MAEHPVDGVVRPTSTAEWRLLREGRVVASAHAVFRPDRRCFVSIDAWDESAYDPLLVAVTADVRRDLHTLVDAADEVDLRRWQSLGFRPARREVELTLPVAAALARLTAARVPDGIVLVPADGVEETALRELDNALRDDVPGSDGWRSDPDEFRDRTFDERSFDPSTYLVAVDDAQRAFAGLVRIWLTSNRARLGLVAVTPTYRRRGLARALLAAALLGVQQRGVPEVGAEADETNAASLQLLEGLGARRTGATVELVRPARSSDGADG